MHTHSALVRAARRVISTSLLRPPPPVPTSHPTRQFARNLPLSHITHRRFCAAPSIDKPTLHPRTAKPVQPSERSSPSSTTGATEPAAASTTVTSTSPEPTTFPSTSTVSTSPTSSTTSSASATATPVSTTTNTPTKSPDVPPTSLGIPSTSLGLFEETDANDPNKWKKFLWKYAGAVILFFVSYKTLHWYVDKVEADGKRRRAQLDEDRKLAKEIRESPPSNPFANVPPSQSSTPVATLQPQQQVATAATTTTASTVPAAASEMEMEPKEIPQQEPLEFLEQLAAQVPKGTSELDELYAYRKELQGQLSDLAKKGGEQAQAEMNDVKAELEALVEDIAMLEKKG